MIMRNPPVVIVGFPGNQPIRFGSVLNITAAATAHPNIGFGAIILFKTFQTIIVESDNQIMRINFSTFFLPISEGALPTTATFFPPADF